MKRGTPGEGDWLKFHGPSFRNEQWRANIVSLALSSAACKFPYLLKYIETRFRADSLTCGNNGESLSEAQNVGGEPTSSFFDDSMSLALFSSQILHLFFKQALNLHQSDDVGVISQSPHKKIVSQIMRVVNSNCKSISNVRLSY